MTKDHIKKTMHQLMQARPASQSVQIMELVTALNRAAGLTIDDYRETLGEALDELKQKQYIQCTATGSSMPIYFRGLEFDGWAEEFASRNSSGNATEHSFIFNGPVGSVQTGPNAVANVVQTLGEPDKVRLVAALRELQKNLASADLSVTDRADLSEIAEDTIVELDKDRPNRIRLTSSLNTIAQSVQTVAALLPAYQAIKVAVTPLGIHLP